MAVSLSGNVGDIWLGIAGNSSRVRSYVDLGENMK
jgi:hypothetical protein